MLIFAILTFSACNTEQSVIDYAYEESQNVLQQKSYTEYSLDEVLNGIRKWDSLRSDSDALLYYFENYNALNLDISQFPQGSALHAYACILNGELKFAVISEIYDHETYQVSLNSYIKVVDPLYKDITTLTEQTYESYMFPLPTQYIQAEDAIGRIQDWNANYTTWLSSNLPVYQSFKIPTYSLQAQNYTVYFGFKNNAEDASVKVADLVFYDDVGLFYNRVWRRPPYPNDEKYYILDLI